MKKIFSKFEKFFRLSKKAIYFAWHRHHFLIPPKTLLKYISSFRTVLKRSGTAANLFTNQKEYLKWIEKEEVPFEHKKFKYNPKISIVMPTYNVSRKFLSECLDSILNQTYTNFEVCIADDCSTKEETKVKFVRSQARLKAFVKTKNILCGEKYETFNNLGRFSMRYEGSTIGIGKILKIKPYNKNKDSK